MADTNHLATLDTAQLRTLLNLNRDILALIALDMHNLNGYGVQEHIDTIRMYRNLLWSQQGQIISIIESRMI